ncbi:MAG: response regulator [Proteobacteria bacterium]|nr:response regulator [Pseudomonadota bacterium]MBU0967092.1 response regulator [Pseudomonadota bacterium]
MRTLIVTDDMSTSNLLAHWLRKFRFTPCAIADSGSKALRMVRNAFFGLVFLDLALPDMPGEILIPALKAVHGQMPIITMTDSNCRELERKVRSHGIIFYMEKPVSVNILQELLRHHIQKKQIAEQLNQIQGGQS